MKSLSDYRGRDGSDAAITRPAMPNTAHKKVEEARNGVSPRASADFLILNFWPPRL